MRHSNIILTATVASLALMAFTGQSVAQAPYPSQRVSVLVGFAPGGFADIFARIVAARLGERLGQSFVVQNLEGAGSIRATRQLTIAPPDGYTILVTTTAIAINESLVPGRGYTAGQIQPVAIPVSAPEGMNANVQAGIKTVSDLVAMAKAGKVFLGSPGLGSGSHIAAKYFFHQLVKVDVKHIPFAGGTPAARALITGDVNVVASTSSVATIRNVRNGDVVGLAVASPQRSKMLPEVPTFAESGYPQFQASSWAGFFLPAGTPAAIAAKLNSEINAILQEEETRKRVEAIGTEISLRDTNATAAFFKDEILHWSNMIKASGIEQ